MDKQSNWAPNRDEAIKALIRQTISAAGPISPEKLPHHIKTVLEEQLGRGSMASDNNVIAANTIDAYIAEILKEEVGKEG